MNQSTKTLEEKWRAFVRMFDGDEVKAKEYAVAMDRIYAQKATKTAGITFKQSDPSPLFGDLTLEELTTIAAPALATAIAEALSKLRSSVPAQPKTKALTQPTQTFPFLYRSK